MRDSTNQSMNVGSRTIQLCALVGSRTIQLCALECFAHLNVDSRTIQLCALFHYVLGAHTPTSHCAAISRFPYIFSKSGPHQTYGILLELVIIWPFSGTLFKSVMCHPSSVRAVQIFDIQMEAISGATKLDFNNSLFRLPETLNRSSLTDVRCAPCYPQSICVWSRKSLNLLEEGQSHPIVRFTYLCHMIGERLSFFPFFRF